MEMKKILNKTLASVIKKKNQKKAVKEFMLFVDEHGWPKTITKQTACKGLDMFINEKLEQKPFEALLDTLRFQRRKMPELTDYQRQMLVKMKNVIINADVKTCDHKLHLGAFIHGGGFCPPFPKLEVICERCGLNVTVPQGNKNHRPESVGLIIEDEQLETLNKWKNDCFKNRKLTFAEVITQDPIKALEKTVLRPGKFPFKIIDLEKLESKSGV